MRGTGRRRTSEVTLWQPGTRRRGRGRMRTRWRDEIGVQAGGGMSGVPSDVNVRLGKAFALH